MYCSIKLLIDVIINHHNLNMYHFTTQMRDFTLNFPSSSLHIEHRISHLLSLASLWAALFLHFAGGLYFRCEMLDAQQQRLWKQNCSVISPSLASGVSHSIGETAAAQQTAAELHKYRHTTEGRVRKSDLWSKSKPLHIKDYKMYNVVYPATSILYNVIFVRCL